MHAHHVILALIALHQAHHIVTAWRYRAVVLLGQTRLRKLLLAGPPGTGKTTTARLIGTRGWNHTDVEPRLVPAGDLDALPAPAVVSWGFSPPDDLPKVRRMISAGFTLYWLDGDRVASLREYLATGGSEALYYWQMYHLTCWAAEIGGLHPVRINPFWHGKFRPAEEIASEVTSCGYNASVPA